MKLYELHKEMTDIENALDEYAQEHDGDITKFPYEKHFDSLGVEFNKKLLNLGAWFKNIKADVDAHKREIVSQQKKMKVAQNKAEWIKGYILAYIPKGETLKDSRVALGWRESKAIEFDDLFNVDDLEDKYVTIVKTPSKTKLKEDLEKKSIIDNVYIVTKQNLQIK